MDAARRPRRLIAPMTAALVLGVACTHSGSASSPSASATSPSSVELPGLITFSVDEGSAYQIYTVRPDGTDLQQITHIDGDAVRPDWSPDGRQIAFSVENPPKTPPFCFIEIMNADGSGIVDLTGHRNGCEGDPSFSPDGSLLLFPRYDDIANVEAIWSMDLKGEHRRRITHFGSGSPEISPDGTRLAFVRVSDEGKSLWVAEADGSHAQQLLPMRSDVADKIDWSSDSQRILLTVNADIADKPANIATIRPDGTNLTLLTDYQSPEIRAYVGGYSPDGHFIVFRLEDHGMYGLYRMNADGSDVAVILPLSPSFRPRFIDWGP